MHRESVKEADRDLATLFLDLEILATGSIHYEYNQEEAPTAGDMHDWCHL